MIVIFRKNYLYRIQNPKDDFVFVVVDIIQSKSKSRTPVKIKIISVRKGDELINSTHFMQQGRKNQRVTLIGESSQYPEYFL